MRERDTGGASLEIIVCIKQVPATANVEVDPVTGVLKREGVESKVNPYDLFAVETSLRLREAHGGNVTVLTMGPPAAREALAECLYLGADRAVLLTDRRFAGADVLATSYTLSQGIRHLGPYDLIICGKQTTDGDTAQVGPEIAEWLDIPHSTNITGIVGIDAAAIRVRMAMETMAQVQQIQLPCLLAVDKDIYIPRLPSFKRRLQLGDDLPIKVLTLDDLADRDPLHYGLNGSPTQVERVFQPEIESERRMVRGDAQQLATQLVDVLVAQRLI